MRARKSYNPPPYRNWCAMALFRVGIQVIIGQNNCILLGKRRNGYGHDTWGLPGGALEPGESFESAAIREVSEETGLCIVAPRVFGVANDLSSPHAHHIQIGMIPQSWTGDPELREPDRCAEWQFCPLDALPAPLFAPSTPLIEQYRRLPRHVGAAAARRPTPAGKQQIVLPDRLVLKS